MRKSYKLERDLEKVHRWSQTWGMEFSSSKCHIMGIGKSKNWPRETYKMGRENIKVLHEKKGSGCKDARHPITRKAYK